MMKQSNEEPKEGGGWRRDEGRERLLGGEAKEEEVRGERRKAEDEVVF